jgi:hypothetical protein
LIQAATPAALAPRVAGIIINDTTKTDLSTRCASGEAPPELRQAFAALAPEKLALLDASAQEALGKWLASQPGQVEAYTHVTTNLAALPPVFVSHLLLALPEKDLRDNQKGLMQALATLPQAQLQALTSQAQSKLVRLLGTNQTGLFTNYNDAVAHVAINLTVAAPSVADAMHMIAILSKAPHTPPPPPDPAHPDQPPSLSPFQIQVNALLMANNEALRTHLRGQIDAYVVPKDAEKEKGNEYVPEAQNYKLVGRPTELFDWLSQLNSRDIQDVFAFLIKTGDNALFRGIRNQKTLAAWVVLRCKAPIGETLQNLNDPFCDKFVHHMCLHPDQSDLPGGAITAAIKKNVLKFFAEDPIRHFFMTPAKGEMDLPIFGKVAAIDEAYVAIQDWVNRDNLASPGNLNRLNLKTGVDINPYLASLRRYGIEVQRAPSPTASLAASVRERSGA